MNTELRILREESRQPDNILKFVDIDSIRANPFQPRKFFDQASLDDLAKSIKEYGILQPLSVRRDGADSYELIAGERRLKAAKLAGLTEVPVILINVKDRESAILALIENLQREDLNYFDEAEALSSLIEEHNMTQESLASKIGKNQSTIANKIRLLKLAPSVRKKLCDDNLTERHARALLKLRDESLQLQVLKLVVEKEYNVKQTEALVEKTLYKLLGRENSGDMRNIEARKRFLYSIKDIRIFANTIKSAVALMKKTGLEVKAVQIDRADCLDFYIRISKNEISRMPDKMPD